MLQGKKIIIGVSGSIAAYKIPLLVRLLVKAGATVKVVMTQEATNFVTPLTLATVSQHPVLIDIASDNQWQDHVALGYWADLIVIAPASANTIAHLANGLCNNLLHAIYLSAKCPTWIAPAMDADMWVHPAVQQNVARLKSYGHHILPVVHGELASGLIGMGRMSEPEDIISYITEYFHATHSEGNNNKRKAIVTAGPTHEMIDPVRFIGNMSSGKMGKALAHYLDEIGWEVILITGPGVAKDDIKATIRQVPIVSAEDMLAAVKQDFASADLVIMAAAVADFRPSVKQEQKIKKTNDDNLQIDLIKNPDILAHLGSIKQEGQVIVGFALETNDEMTHAAAKLRKKNADFIALNSLKDEAVGFGKDTNNITLLAADGSVTPLGKDTKQALAKKMIDIILKNEKLAKL